VAKGRISGFPIDLIASSPLQHSHYVGYVRVCDISCQTRGHSLQSITREHTADCIRLHAWLTMWPV